MREQAGIGGHVLEDEGVTWLSRRRIPIGRGADSAEETEQNKPHGAGHD
jgi:hypothetical protein